jgi:hypothetical protein
MGNASVGRRTEPTGCVMLANASIENATTLQGMPLCAALGDFRLNSRLRRAPRLDRRFRILPWSVEEPVVSQFEIRKARLALASLDVPAMISGNQVRQYGIARRSRGRSLEADVRESGWADALVGDTTIQLG